MGRKLEFCSLSLVLLCATAFGGPAVRQAVEYPAAGAVAGEIPAAVAVDQRGFTYVAGTAAAASRSHRGGQALYVTKIDASGQERIYTAHLGGSGAVWVKGIALSRLGEVYVTGYTSSGDFPVTGGVQGAAGGGLDAFVAKLDAKGETWLYSTYLGGSGDDVAEAIAVDSDGNAYVTGRTSSADFPLHDALQSTKAGETSAFVAKLNPDGSSLAYSTYLAGDAGDGIAADRMGAAYITGETGDDGFLIRVSPDGAQREFSNRLSGKGTSVATDSAGAAYVAGWSVVDGKREVFASKYASDGTRQFFAVLGAWNGDTAPSIAVDAAGSAYITGLTEESEAGSYPKFVKLSTDGTQQIVSSSLDALTVRGGLRLAVDPSGTAVVTGTRSTGRGYLGRVATCSYRPADGFKQIPQLGESGTIAIGTTPGCSWTAAASASWVEVSPSPAADGTLHYTVTANPGAARGASISVAGQTILLVQQGAIYRTSAGGFTGPIRTNPGFGASSLPACDDSCNSGAVNLGFSINFYGNPYTQVYVNNNGNVTFGASNSTYSPNPIPQITSVMIAPFWADVDTRAGAVVTYGTDTVDGHPAFGVNSINVGYFNTHTDKLNSFQLVLIGRADVGAGFFDIEMNYSSIQWETGDASGGSNGFGGTSARVGFTNGTNTTGTYFELPGSGVHGAFLDGGPNSLAANSVNSNIPGRYIYPVRAGTVICATGISPATAGITNAGGQLAVHVTASNSTCTWTVTGLPSWITIVSPTNGNGTGTGDLTLQVQPFSGTIRQATMVVATQNYTVTQGGPDLSIIKSHVGGFQPNDTGKNYTITVTNSGGSPTTGTATVTDTLPTGLTATAISGSGWSCTLGTLTCTRSDALNALTSYPPITLTVNVAANAPGLVINTATVSGGGSVTTNNKTANDPTGIGPPDLTITKIHSGNFHQGDTADTYTITVANSGGSTTTGTVTVVDQLPASMTATGMSGLGWSCTLSSKTCTRADGLAATASYPPITLTVSVSASAPGSVTNVATVSGGGESNTSNDSASDTTTITGTGSPSFSITKTHTGTFHQGDVGDTYTITVTNSGAVTTAGTVTVVDTLPTGLTATAISGTGWSCTLGSLTCTRVDSLAPGTSYPVITLTVSVAAGAPSAVTNSAAVSGGGVSGTATATDPTTISGPTGPGCATSFNGLWFFPAYGNAQFTLGSDGFITGYLGSLGPVTHGTVSGNVLDFYWGGTNGGYPGRFQVSADGMTLVGVPYQFVSGVLGPWTGSRVTTSTPAVACTTNNGGALWTGDWFTTPFGRVAAYQNLNGSVTIWAPPSCTTTGGTFIGTPSGNTLTGAYSVPGGGGGTFTLTIPTADVATFTGTYTPAGGAATPFTGSRQPPGVIQSGNMTLGTEYEGGGYVNGASYGFLGRWDTPFGIVTLKVNSDRSVTGSYPNGGVITGTVSAVGPFSGPSFPDDGVTFTGTYADALGSSGTIAWKLLGGYIQGTTTSSGGATSYWAAGRSFSWAGTWAATVTSFGSGGGAVTQGNFVIAKTNSTILNTGSPSEYGQAANQIAQFSNINFIGGLWTGAGDSSGCCFGPIFTSSTPWPSSVSPSTASTTGYASFLKGTSASDGNPLMFYGDFNGVNQVTATWTSDSIAGLNFCPATPSPFTGTFSTPLGTMTVSGSGSTLTGTIPGGPTFTGTVNGNTWSGTYTGPNGPGTFTFTNNGNGFTGTYTPSGGSPIGLSGTPTTEPIVNNRVQTIPPGLPVIIDGVTQTSPQTASWTAGTSHTIAAGQPAPSGGTQYLFNYWSDGGASSHAVIAPATPVNYTAVYTTQYLLNVTAGTGGTVSPISGYYNSGATVQIAAVPAAGYTFTGWTGSGSGSYTGNVNPAVVTVNAPITQTANFAPFTAQFALTTNVSPAAGGSVTLSPSAANNLYNAGTAVQVTAVANPGYLFSGWSGDLSGLTNPQSLTMNAAHTVTANFIQSSTTGLGFVPINPCRVVDTRAGSGKTGAFGAPTIVGGASRDFPILSGGCNIPSNVRAYSMTITAVPTSGPLGYLTAWPSGQTQPFVSTLNASDGSPTANAAILPAGTNGNISVFMSNTADVIIDINGYFIPPGGGALAFYPVTPCRVADTRAGQGKSGQYGPPSIPFNQSRDIPVPASGCGVPANAQAYSLNITALPATGKLNFVTGWPTGMPMPVASNLNSFLGKVQANAAIIGAGTNGGVSFFVSDTTDLIVDINGYFAPPGGTGALYFNNVTPCRVADTRGAAGPFGGPSVPFNAERDFPLRQSSCGLPATAQAYSLNMTVVPPGALTYLTTWPGAPAPLPIVSTLNSFDGRVIANAAIVPASGTGGIGVYVSNTTDVIIDVNGYFAP